MPYSGDALTAAHDLAGVRQELARIPEMQGRLARAYYSAEVELALVRLLDCLAEIERRATRSG